jgi:ribosomal-protein-alanine N-acetyltransferase
VVKSTMAEPDEIAAARLTLRPLAREHVAGLHSVFADTTAMAFWGDPPHPDPAATAVMIERLIDSGAKAWAVFARGDDQACGLICFIDAAADPALSYILRREIWGRGLMSEALGAIVEHAFTSLGLDRLTLWIDMRNHASLGVAARAGFRLHALLPGAGDPAHARSRLVAFRLTRSAWRRQRDEASDGFRPAFTHREHQTERGQSGDDRDGR